MTTTADDEPSLQRDSDAELSLVRELIECMGDEVTFIVGSGVGGSSTLRVASIVRLADQYALGRGDGGDLSRALAEAKVRLANASETAIYAEYRRLFGAWVSGAEFDVIAQQAVLDAYRPTARVSSAVATHGIWQRVSQFIGEEVENDNSSWEISPGVEALGALIASQPGTFGRRVLTTNFDPMLEIAIRRAGGRAVSVPVGVEGSITDLSRDQPAIRVYHLHGFWRPTLESSSDALLHDPAQIARDRLRSTTASLIHGDTVCVVGSSDWAHTTLDALAELRSASQREPRVIWVLHSAGAPRLRQGLLERGLTDVNVREGIDAERLFVLLAEDAGVSVVRDERRPRHRYVHTLWEQELVSWPTASPPESIDALIRQLERRFGWGLKTSDAFRPEILFWPVRLQPRATVIHMVQALVAGALAQRGMRLVISVDDFNSRQSDLEREAFRADLQRWVHHVAPEVSVEFSDVSAFIARLGNPTPDDLVRRIDPWHVARDFYGTHNPSLYSLLVAIKALPNLTLRQIDESPEIVVQALLRNNAQRLLTPLTMWPILHNLLRSAPTGSVLTIGGWDEGPYWEQWRQVYGLGVGQLYNPYCRSLSHRSGLVAWTSEEELVENLQHMLALAGWDEPGGYIPWLFQNGMLLPTYLNRGTPPEANGASLRAWATFSASLNEGDLALRVVAQHVSQLYLGRSNLQ